jgi:hypothetical protein
MKAKHFFQRVTMLLDLDWMDIGRQPVQQLDVLSLQRRLLDGIVLPKLTGITPPRYC